MFGVEPTVVRTQSPCDVPVENSVWPPSLRQMTGDADVELVIVGDRAVGEVAQDAPVPFSKITVFAVVVEKLVIS